MRAEQPLNAEPLMLSILSLMVTVCNAAQFRNILSATSTVTLLPNITLESVAFLLNGE